MRCFSWLLFILVIVPGCVINGESGPVSHARLGLSPRQNDWAVRVFGRPPDLVNSFRPYPGMDTANMRIDDQRPERTAQGVANVRCHQVDGYIYGDVGEYLQKGDDKFLDGVLVLHGVPSWLDPTRSPTGETEFVFTGRSASGVRAYREAANTKYQTHLFVLPSSTWIISHGAVFQRLGDVLAADNTPPPQLEMVPGTFADETRMVDDAKRHELMREGWIPELRQLDRLNAYGLVAYPVPRGSPLLIGVKLVFSDSDAAGNAADAALRDPALRSRHLAGVDRFGSTVVIKSWATD